MYINYRQLNIRKIILKIKKIFIMNLLLLCIIFIFILMMVKQNKQQTIKYLQNRLSIAC